MIKLIFITLSFFLGITVADFFLQNPRGSNGRLNEANANRNNGNRLFDSQNNAKGGYCIGPRMQYYEGSILSVEYSGSHGCGSPSVTCNIVMQYMCGAANNADGLSAIRDGFTTNTIDDDNVLAASTVIVDGVEQLKYGMHESFSYYQDCKVRNRNKGLWIADREVQGGLTDGRASAIYTRQNNNGDRRGFECSEERDYYPYWHPSPWKDIAVLTDKPDTFCPYYKAQSQNVLKKNFCRDNVSGKQSASNNAIDCAAAGHTWTEAPAYGIAAPDCQDNDPAIDNVQEVSFGRYKSYRWKLPVAATEPCIATDNCVCVMRVRYNVSSSEVANSPTQFIDRAQNGAASPILKEPLVTIGDVDFELAMDSSQFGRVFQDRTHTFGIRKRPVIVPAAATVHNLNVKGKRGNIVQTYPSIQYDFAPLKLDVVAGDYIHFQWTGCDTNPAGNAGEGTDQTDRSNIVQIEGPGFNKPASAAWLAANPNLFTNSATKLKFALLDQVNCLSKAQILAQNGNNEGNAEQDLRNCGKLNAAGPYFDGGLIQMSQIGKYFYLSTRNNNFSNRGQKGQITVHPVGWVEPNIPLCEDITSNKESQSLDGMMKRLMRSLF